MEPDYTIVHSVVEDIKMSTVNVIVFKNKFGKVEALQANLPGDVWYTLQELRILVAK